VARLSRSSHFAGQPLVTNAALAVELTHTRRDDATTRRKNLASHFDGFCPLAAPRFARWQE
jgi:hypothetical protein